VPEDGRLEIQKAAGTALFDRFTDHNWKIVDALVEVSNQLGRPPAEVALNWVATQPGSTSTILGVTKVAQMDSNLSSLDFSIPGELRDCLDRVSTLDPTAHPYVFFGPKLQARLRGNIAVRPGARAAT